MRNSNIIHEMKESINEWADERGDTKDLRYDLKQRD